MADEATGLPSPERGMLKRPTEVASSCLAFGAVGWYVAMLVRHRFAAVSGSLAPCSEPYLREEGFDGGAGVCAESRVDLNVVALRLAARP